MIVPDTSVWIEFLKGREPISTLLGGLIEDGGVLAVECVFGELLQGARSPREAGVIRDYWNLLPKAGQPGVWLRAGDLSREGGFPSKGVGLIDAAIIASARQASAKVWSLDKKLLKAMAPSERFEI